MKYEEMSDFEISQAVTCEVYGCHEWSVNQEGTFYHCGPDGSGIFIQKVADYCNNPSDAWPIIVENKISIVPTGGWWRARPEKTACPEQFHDNPLRAAMIVFLIIQEAKRG